MPFLNAGRSGTALLLTGSYALPDGMEIGTGSQSYTVNSTGLVAPIIFRAFTVATDVSTPRFVTFTSDFTSVELSGTTIKEFAVRKSGGTVWSADGINGITFDGSIEMQVQATWQVF